MTGLVSEIDMEGFADVIKGFTAFENIGVTPLEIASGIALSAAQNRLRNTKRAPDGTPWADWSEGYKKTRHGGHSLLMGEGDLDDSLSEFQRGNVGGVGSNLVYAAVQHFGGAEVGMNIPARPYLGLSDEEAVEIKADITDFLERTMEDAQ